MTPSPGATPERPRAGTSVPAPLLRPAELEDLQQHGHLVHREPGGAVFAEGDRAGWVAYVLAGHAKVSRTGPDGSESVLAVRGSGTFLGEMSAIDDRPRSATVTVLDAFEAVVIDAAAFRVFLRSHPRVAVELLRLLSRRLRESDRLRTLRNSVSTGELVAYQLCELAAQFRAGTKTGTATVIPLEQRELAALAGVSRESVNRALGALRRRGLIETRRGAIHVTDVCGLRRLTDQEASPPGRPRM